MWGGRFEAGLGDEMFSLSVSTHFDMALLGADVAATKAHAKVLEAAGLLTSDEVKDIGEVLDALRTNWEQGDVAASASDEDVHSFVERMLIEALGDTGRKIHAGRSRNDLVATDVRLYSMAAIDELTREVTRLLSVIVATAKTHTDTVMPGFTHMQPAQPVSLGFHLMAHACAFERDITRLSAARASSDVSPLGAGAIAGTTLPLDATTGMRELGFSGAFQNAMDAVSDRDFVADLLYATAMIGIHLSRLAEEIVLWATPAFGFVSLPDAWSTGSSMMPQKRNPDMAELIRGRSAPAIGDLTSILTLLKGLPLAYDRDLQEDKEVLFRSVGRSLGCVRGMSGMLEELSFDVDALASAAEEGAMWATDLAEVLVARGIPFRSAHEVVGGLVARLDKSKETLSADILAETHAAFEPEDLALVAPGAGMRARRSHGGTAPERVIDQIEALETRLGLDR